MQFNIISFFWKFCGRRSKFFLKKFIYGERASTRNILHGDGMRKNDDQLQWKREQKKEKKNERNKERKKERKKERLQCKKHIDYKIQDQRIGEKS